MTFEYLYPVLLVVATTYAHHSPLYEPPTLTQRVSWLARPPQRRLPDNVLPARELVLQYTGGEECDTPAACVVMVQDLQTYHMDSLGLDDVAYNFLIGGDGVVYVGRGWTKEGAHTPHHNQGSIGIVFLGDFNDTLPSREQLEAFSKLLTLGLHEHLISDDYVLVGQCQVMISTTPQEVLSISDSSDNQCNTLDGFISAL